MLHESGDLGFDLVVVGVVHHFPVVFLLVKHSVDSENRHNFLRVPVNVFLEVNQTVYDRGLERFRELLVELFEEVEPLGLDVLLAGKEKLLVGGDELRSDNLEVVLKCLLLQL